jgi:hypothetical protein
MSKAEELKTTKALVLSILKKDKQARNSDSYLYLQVLKYQASLKGIDLDGLTVPFFLANISALGLPPFETVRRARQLIQATFPELAGSEAVEIGRAENELIHRDFARGAI